MAIQRLRGIEANKPVLFAAEIYYATDAEKLFIGRGDGTDTIIQKSDLFYLKVDVDALIASAENYADNKIASLVASAPTALNTLNELATALANDPNFATTITNLIATKATSADLTAHTGNINNPHTVTKAQVGLGNVPNTDVTDPNNISQDSNHRFTSDSEKTIWNNKEDMTNKVTSFNNPTDLQYPSAKLVADTLASLQVVGLQWNKITDTYTRLGTAAGKSRSFFDTIAPFVNMRRCTLNDLGIVIAYYGDANFIEDGSNGQVMVEIPKFWYRTEQYSWGYRWYISSLPRSGYKVHPYFVVNGIERDYMYFGAYEASAFDVSALAYNLTDQSGKDFTVTTGDKLASIAGAIPISGSADNLTIENMRILAHNRGVGWEQQDFLGTSAIQLLMLIEYGGFDLRSLFYLGLLAGEDDGTNLAVGTGQTSALGNTSGEVTVVHYSTQTVVHPCSYRGIENFWGNMEKFVDGINFLDNKPWFADHAFNSNTNVSPYVNSNAVLADRMGWIKDIAVNSNFDFAFLPSAIGGSSSTYIDSCYYPAPNPGITLYGGSWIDAGVNNSFYFDTRDISLFDYYIGGRLQFKKQN